MATKVLLLELNEINWNVIDKLIAERGDRFLPNFCSLREAGSWGTPAALEQPPLLDPWITWVTLHTGVTQEVHGARVLEQDTETVTARRTWEYAAEAGLKVGVFGSIGAFPPRQLPGFMVPGPFAPTNATHPPELEPIQHLNRLHTRAHGENVAPQALGPMIKTATQLMLMGLRPLTIARICTQLAAERIHQDTKWRRAVLQPLINFDVFSRLYRQHRPDYATWHSNHAAHFMHHYWRAWDDAGFQVAGSEKEHQRYGEAVPLGYRVCDELIGRFRKMIDDRTVLIVASSMGQQPYVNAAYQEGKIIVRFRNARDFFGRLDDGEIAEIVPTMVPQINLRVPAAVARERLAARLAEVTRIVGDKVERALAVEETGELLTVTPLGLASRRERVSYRIPGNDAQFDLEELFAVDAATTKQGMHHPDGLFIAAGPGVPKGMRIANCSNLDIAPTILNFLGIPKPAAMIGRPLVPVDA